MAKIQKIKENINQKEYIKLMNSIRGNQTIRKNTKNNLLRTFCILYYTGLRLNELQQLLIRDIKELIKNSTVKIDIPKTKTQRKLFASNDFKKELNKIFDFSNEEDNNKVISKGSNKDKKTSINNIVFISQVNHHIKDILGIGFSSHSFRQGLITQMGSRGINTKIISKYIGHKDIKTTMRYITPCDNDIQNSIIR